MTGHTGNADAPWLGLQVPDSLRTSERPPTLQWINWPEKLSNAETGVPFTEGGFFAAERHGALQLAGGKPALYDGQDSEADRGVYAGQIRAAVLATRSLWGRWEGRRWTKQPHDAEGSRKRVDALLLVETETGPTLAKMTLVGTVNNALTEALDLFQRDAKAAKAEPWMFWLTLRSAGKPQKVGDHKTRMTPMVVETPAKDDLATAFIGADWVAKVIEMESFITDWRGKYRQQPDAQEMAFEQALGVKVKTRQGVVTFRDLISQDPDYAHEVMVYVVEHPDEFSPTLVSSASLILAAPNADDLADSGATEEDQIPF